ncbi:hypothetical protein appser11_2360 [Actinobacillus pleuropneumoniae serovar 11 str. 56153]|nr:hypothetical protein appser11_2360 [Actinobacillus pleuropneumoniae serovar 11 str. 56153]
MEGNLMPFGLHCRIGSLENKKNIAKQALPLHCRIGSLEIVPWRIAQAFALHCRIGSLEKR